MKAKADVRYFGGKPTARAKCEHVHELIGQGLTKTLVANELIFGVVSVYQILKNYYYATSVYL